MKTSIIKQCLSKAANLLQPKLMGDTAGRYIGDKIADGCPLMVARLGAVEVKAVLYGILPPPIKYLLTNYVKRTLHTNAGFFPVDDDAIRQFAELMLDSMKQVDILASWRLEELLFMPQLRRSVKIPLGELDPAIGKDYVWSSALEGKDVLVVHPFAESIQRQYEVNRKRLFDNPAVLPKFKSLQTIKAVQTIAGNTMGFKSWFDALEYMEKEISQRNFDIALIGCGAYGFPLAAYVKGMGRKAVHIGGALQLYFGIKGKRWDNRNMYNEYWVSPSSDEKPRNLEKVENGCYW